MGLTCKDGHLPHGGNGGFLDGHAFVFGALAYIWDCSPMAEFSGLVEEIHYVMAEPQSTIQGLLSGGRSLNKTVERRFRWSAQRGPIGYKRQTGTSSD